MVYKIADNILSPLGETTEQNYQAVKAGRSALCRYSDHWQLPEPFSASLFSEAQWQVLAAEGLTPFEALATSSVRRALKDAAVDPARKGVVLIISTTKGNVDQLTQETTDDLSPGASARKMARVLGFTTEPIVVCNACISGVSALLLAARLLEAGTYDVAVVCGADVQSRFVVSGFQSFHVVSSEACRPFDMERTGLSLGEAAATMILSRQSQPQAWGIVTGAVRNDAFHISSPAKDGEGACQALRQVMQGVSPSQLAFINAHGTATMFNDQMESVAIERAGLSSVSVNGYKGYYGHTMGAAGVLETILSMAALDDHTILGTKGFEEAGVSGKIRLVASSEATDKQAFVKVISGFGGCNAALLVAANHISLHTPQSTLHDKIHVLITPERVCVDGRDIAFTGTGKTMLTDLYKRYVGDYPKFYKMDRLSQLGFIASELLLQAEGRERFEDCDDRAIILFNHASSIMADRQYLSSIETPGQFFPSPSLFVYTLPNIVAGELAIRNHYHGETTFCILPERQDEVMRQVLQACCQDETTRSILGGWVDYQDDAHYVADLTVYEVREIVNS
jgi:3-oxoacyl-[acyl-carrier-protein] synthase-1